MNIQKRIHKYIYDSVYLENLGTINQIIVTLLDI